MTDHLGDDAPGRSENSTARAPRRQVAWLRTFAAANSDAAHQMALPGDVLVGQERVAEVVRQIVHS
jgi:hypothetical protein